MPCIGLHVLYLNHQQTLRIKRHKAHLQTQKLGLPESNDLALSSDSTRQACLHLLQQGFSLGNTASMETSTSAPPQPHYPVEFLTLCLPFRLGRRSPRRAKSKLYFVSCFLPPYSLYLFLENPCCTHPPTLPQKNPKKASQLYLNTTQVFRTSSGLLVRSGSPSGLGAILINRMQSCRRDLGLGG